MKNKTFYPRAHARPKTQKGQLNHITVQCDATGISPDSVGYGLAATYAFVVQQGGAKKGRKVMGTVPSSYIVKNGAPVKENINICEIYAVYKALQYLKVKNYQKRITLYTDNYQCFAALTIKRSIYARTGHYYADRLIQRTKRLMYQLRAVVSFTPRGELNEAADSLSRSSRRYDYVNQVKAYEWQQWYKKQQRAEKVKEVFSRPTVVLKADIDHIRNVLQKHGLLRTC